MLGARHASIEVVPTLDTNAYADNDILFVATAAGGFPSLGHIEVDSIRVLDESDQAQDLDILFLASAAALGTINTAANPTDAAARAILGMVSIVAADYIDLANSQLAMKRGIALPLYVPPTGLYIAGILRSGTPTYAAAGLRITIGYRY